MSLTNDQLLQRIVAMENMMNNIQTALNNLASKNQLKQLLQIRQSEINTLQETIIHLTARITALENT